MELKIRKLVNFDEEIRTEGERAANPQRRPETQNAHVLGLWLEQNIKRFVGQTDLALPGDHGVAGIQHDRAAIHQALLHLKGGCGAP